MRIPATILLGLLGCAGLAQAQVNTQYGQQAAASEQNNADISVFGYQSLYACDYCYGATAIGFEVLRVSSGYYNTGVGYLSMYNSTSGSYNTGIGAYTMTSLGSGQQNVAIGYDAGSCATVNGSYNIWISHCGLAKDDRVIRIGTPGLQKGLWAAGVYNTKLPAGGGQALYVNSKGQIGILSTTIHTSAEPAAASLSSPASLNDVLSLRREIASLHNEVYALKAQLRK